MFGQWSPGYGKRQMGIPPLCGLRTCAKCRKFYPSYSYHPPLLNILTRTQLLVVALAKLEEHAHYQRHTLDVTQSQETTSGNYTKQRENYLIPGVVSYVKYGM